MDRVWMAQALALGARGEGTASPNPRVGCVIVRDERLVGCGYHTAPGEPHAEAIAIDAAGAAARGATVYVNLEPCAHHGRTPPCADLLIRSGVARVVAAMGDPDPRVDGRGFAALEHAGIEVEVGLLGDAGRRLNAAFVHWHQRATPRVTLKAAASLDGRLSADAGESRWITGGDARTFAHRLRLRHDAILIGAGTLRADDPRLTVRLPGVDASRLRVVLSSGLDLDPCARIFASGDPVRVYTTADDAEAKLPGAEIVRAPSGERGLDLAWVLRDLGARGVQSLLVEGGGRTHASFLEAGLAHDVALFVAGTLLGHEGATPLIDGPAVASPAEGWKVADAEWVAVGADRLLLGRLARAGQEG
ncbi:MAG: bifunctional diaminohydroxyphosphoribosylaminopyrimidine deaminase/5-amino-6-(5-phosphoribosylamino)uracil reductase RibD [bacterium]|nr:bifunctional diaminohydroxyphosphoribosylaminopyrimidine deaminase/5-amino-6-(5-phosphoribosylamino)uracil reductase RibD [bacterium]